MVLFAASPLHSDEFITASMMLFVFSCVYLVVNMLLHSTCLHRERHVQCLSFARASRTSPRTPPRSTSGSARRSGYACATRTEILFVLGVRSRSVPLHLGNGKSMVRCGGVRYSTVWSRVHIYRALLSFVLFQTTLCQRHESLFHIYRPIIGWSCAPYVCDTQNGGRVCCV